MKRSILHFFALIWFLGYFCACSTSKIVKPSAVLTTETCREQVMLRFDPTVDASCGLYFETQDSKRYIPLELNFDSSVEVIVNEKYILDAEIITDIESPCSKKDIIVKLTCLELAQNKNKPRIFSQQETCTQAIDPYAIPWMNECILQYEPTLITKYKKKKDWAYGFTSQTHFYLYDCRAQLLCYSIKSDRTPCIPVLKTMKDTQVILVTNY